MITLRVFLLVISIIALRHAALHTDLSAYVAQQQTFRADRPMYPETLVATCVVFFVVAKFLAVICALHAEVAGGQAAWRRFHLGRVVLEWLWVPLWAVAWMTSDLGKWLIQSELNGAAPCGMLLAWFLPSVLFYAVLEYCTVELELDMTATSKGGRSRRPSGVRTVGAGEKSLANGNQLLHAGASSYKALDASSYEVRARWFDRVRLGAIGQILTCAIPVWIVLTINDLVLWLAPGLSEWMRLAVAIGGLAAISLTLAPLWMCWTVGATSSGNDNPVRSRVAKLCDQLKIPAPRVMLVGPHNNWHGAALVGWTPLFRQLWIGHALVQELRSDQLDMVLLHELAHLKRGHCWWRTLPLVAAGVAVLLCWSGARPTNEITLQQSWVIVLAAGLAWLLGWISRRCELDADRVACREASVMCDWTGGRSARAAEALADALKALHGPSTSAEQRHWLHPSLKARVDHLSPSL